MLTFRDAMALARDASPRTASLTELLELLEAGGEHAEELVPGCMSAHEALATFGIRRRTTLAAGIEVLGLDEVLDALAEVAPDVEVLLFFVTSPHRVFTLVVRPDAKLLGCVRVVVVPGRSRAIALDGGALQPPTRQLKQLYADFNDFTAEGVLPLTSAGSAASIAHQSEPLVEGEEVWLTDGEVRTKARLHRVPTGGWEARSTWQFSDVTPSDGEGST